MAHLTFNQVAIRAVATAVPSFVQKVDLSERRAQKFAAQMGISQRHISITEQTSVELGYVALQDALEHAGWQSSDLDLLLFDTQTPDFNVGNAMLMQHLLKLHPDALVFDQTICCASFPYSLATACTYLMQPNFNKAAIVLGDTCWSLYQNKEELLAAQRFTFGEGTSVVLLERDEQEQYPIDLWLFANGEGYKYLFNTTTSLRNAWRRYEHFSVPDGAKYGSRAQGYEALYMNGFFITYFASKNMSDEIKKIWGDDILNFDYYVFHQGNKQIIDLLAAPLHLPPEKVLTSLEEYGNTNGASPLVTICHRLAHNDHGCHIFNASMGAGLAWGFTDFYLKPNTVCPVRATDYRCDEFFFHELPALQEVG